MGNKYSVYMYNPISTKENLFTTAVSDQTSVDMSKATVSEPLQ